MTSGDKVKKFFLNPWTVGIGVAIFAFALTLLHDVMKDERILSTFVSMVKWVWNAIISFLTFDLKVWWVLIGIGVIILGLWVYSKILDIQSNSSLGPKFLEYTQDYLLDFKWEWIWEKDYYGKYSVGNLQPICIECETPLCNNYTGYYGCYNLKCLRCGKSYSRTQPPENNVKLLIYDNVKKRYFQEEKTPDGNRSSQGIRKEK